MMYAKPTMKVEQMDPEMARTFLRTMDENRNINWYRVDNYAVAMLEGRWRVAQPIQVDKNGKLIDGQNRLLAVVRAGITVAMTVLYGLDPDVKPVIDTGRPRSTADHAKINLHIPNSKKAVTVVRMIDSFFSKQRQFMDNDKFEEQYKTFEKDVQWSFEAFPGTGGVNSNPIRAGLALARVADPSAIEKFAHQVRTGEGLKAGDPAYALRHYFLETLTIDRDDQRVQGIKVLTAAHAHLNGEKVQRLYAKQDAVDFFCRKYPEIKQASPLQQFENARAVLNPNPPDPEDEEIIFEFKSAGKGAVPPIRRKKTEVAHKKNGHEKFAAGIRR